MTKSAVFTRLRSMVLDANKSIHSLVLVRTRPKLIPLHATVDGWYCLRMDGRVIHLDENGKEEIIPDRQATAFAGALVSRFPLMTLFLPRDGTPKVCDLCGGVGTIKGLGLSDLASVVKCKCGGLGWILD